MITYDFTNTDGPLYKALYTFIKKDIESGKFRAGEKIPSKRMLAQNLGISTITVQNAYDQLISEGYLYAVAKKGYYIAELADLKQVRVPSAVTCSIRLPRTDDDAVFNFSSNQTETANFPFSVWTRIMRETISRREKELLTASPCGGIAELKSAIAGHLASFRGMAVDPDQIIVGAGTEYLYGLLVQLLGREQIYCIENPGYKKLRQIYESNGAVCRLAGLDENGVMVRDLHDSGASIAHVSPTHHFPTGITMPVSRRYELLAWANEKEDRYIIEDDYDSEFRLNGKPIPALQSIDACGKVIYLNTFSKSLTSTIRISYMVLPERLANLFYEKLSFYSCTVSTFEQYSLAAFISQGYFEKHINRMRLHYQRKRNRIMEIIRKNFQKDQYHIIENGSGLHFVLQLNTQLADSEIRKRLLEKGIQISTVADFEMTEKKSSGHQFIISYSGVDLDRFEHAASVFKDLINASA